MPIKIISSREFNQDAGKAKKAARNGPVFITDRGRPAHVLLSIEQYQKIAKKRRSIVDLLAMTEDVDFDPAKADIDIRPTDFS